MSAQNALNEAIKTAEAQLAEPEVKTNADGAPEVEIEQAPPGESTETEETETEGGLSETELAEAGRLYAALRDPKTSGPIIAALAQQAGLHLTPTSTKAEVHEATKSITEAVKEALGPQYEFLADKLGSAIKSALDIEKQDTEARFAHIERTRIENETVTAFDKLFKETKGESKRLEARMASLSEEIPIGKMNVDTYIKRLYTVASAESAKSNQKAIAAKIQKNATDVPGRLRSTGAGIESKNAPTERMNINQSINWALGKIAEDQNKGR